MLLADDSHLHAPDPDREDSELCPPCGLNLDPMPPPLGWLVLHLACAHDAEIDYYGPAQLPQADEIAWCFHCEREVQIIGHKILLSEDV